MNNEPETPETSGSGFRLENVTVLQLALGLFSLAFGLQLLNFVVFGWGDQFITPFPRSDAYYYLHKAWMQAFIDPSGGALAAYVPKSPYVFAIKTMYQWFGSYTWIPYVLNAFLTSVTIGAVAAATWLAFDNRYAAFAAGIITAMWGTLYFFAELTVKTNMVMALGSLALCFTFWSLRRNSFVLSAAAHSLFWVASMDRNNLAVFPVLLLLWQIVRIVRDTSSNNLWRAAAGGVVVAVIAGAASQPDFWPVAEDAEAPAVVTAPLGINLWVGNNDNALGTYTPNSEIRNDIIGTTYSARKVAEKYLERELTDTEVEAFWIARAYSFLKRRPGQATELLLRKTGMMFSAEAYGHPEQFGLWRFQRLVYYFALLDSGSILALACFGLWALRRKKLPGIADQSKAHANLLVVFAAVYAASVILFFVVERFRLPFILVLLPLAGVAAATIWQADSRKFKLAGMGSVLLLYAGTWGLTALHPEGVGWVTEKEPRRTYEHFQKSQMAQLQHLRNQAITGKSPDAASKLALAIFGSGLPSDALKIAQYAVDLNPNHPAGYEALLDIYLKQKDRFAIERLFLKLVYTKPLTQEYHKRITAMKSMIAEYLGVPLLPGLGQ